MRLRHRVEGPQIIAEARRTIPLGPGFEEALIDQATRMEVWVSVWHEESDDRTEFRLFRGEQLIQVRCVPGF